MDTAPSIVDREGSGLQTFAVRLRQVGLLFKKTSDCAHGLHPTDLSILAGEFLAVLGPNGSGKSTLIRLIAGVQRSDSGELDVLGERLVGGRTGRATRASLGVVFQSLSLDPLLTIRENLRVFGAIFGIRRTEVERRLARLAEAFDLLDRLDDRVRTLSGGLARRADLCRALLPAPELLVLDEPSAGLDLHARRTLSSTLAALQREQSTRPLTIVLATHHIDEADLASRVVMLHGGRIVADGPPARLRDELGPAVFDCHDSPESRRILGSAGLAVRAGVPGRIIVDATTTPTSEIARLCLEHGIPFSVSPPTLADVYLERTGLGLAADEAQP